MWNIEDFITCQYRIRKVGNWRWEVHYKRFLFWIDSGYWYSSRERALEVIEQHKQFGSFHPDKQWEIVN